ncbi:MAG: Ca2+-dependent phosphoinositide-specific phospholipase C [Chitinophagales bacterium]
MRIIFCIFFLIGCHFTFSQKYFDSLKINQIQTLGSHNSYHKRANKFVLRFLKGLSGILPKEFNPKELDYAHEPLNVQLDSFHLRSFEIDIYADPKGGQYYKQKKNNLLGKPRCSNLEQMKVPGFKVMHIPDVDYNSHYLTFKSALAEFKKWSDAHPNHLPIYIMVECKEESVAEKLKKLHFIKTIPFSPEVVNTLDDEIKSVFGDSLNNIITPDKVRGNYATLNEAVLAGNFPTIEAARGKIIFIMMEVGAENYLLNHPSLKDRAMFVFSSPDRPECAFIKHDDAKENETIITEQVRKGYIIRTRADSPNNQNRSGDYSQQTAAFRSGAQIISSDYYTPDPRYKKHPKKFKNYYCRFPGNDIGRINPVNVPETKLKE